MAEPGTATTTVVRDLLSRIDVYLAEAAAVRLTAMSYIPLQRRAQAQKARVVKTANPEYVEAMQGLRRSSAAQPHRSKKAYQRKPKYGGWA